MKLKLNSTQVVFMGLSSMIGMGIFSKSHELQELFGGNTDLTIIAFSIVAMSVILLSFALLKIIPNQTSNQGFLEWTKKFCPNKFNIFSINYLRFIYNPISLMLSSIFLVLKLQGKIVTHPLITLFISFALIVIFMFINFLSFDISKKIQFTLLCVVMVCLIIAPIFGFLSNKEVTPEYTVTPKTMPDYVILGASLPSILFIYDGFYYLTFLRRDIKKPEKMPACITIAFVLVTILYSYFIFGFTSGSKSSKFQDFSFFVNNERSAYVGLFEAVVICAACLTLNASCMSSLKQTIALNQTYSFKTIEITSKFCKINKTMSAFVFLILETLLFLFLLAIGIQMSDIHLMTIINCFADCSSIVIFMILGSILLWVSRKEKWVFWLSILPCLVIFCSFSFTLGSYVLGSTSPDKEISVPSIIKLIIFLSFIFLPTLNLFKKKEKCSLLLKHHFHALDFGVLK